MPRICYEPKNFRSSSMYIIDKANDILRSYAARGTVVTLRQLYYRFVAMDLFPDDYKMSKVGGKWVKDPSGTKNNDPAYNKLGSIINDARLAGLIDWDYLQDRTRNLQSLSHWDSPGDIIHGAAQGYHRELWHGQKNYVEVWIEKDALLGVIESVCRELDVSYFSCRGYTSQSEMWAASQRLLKQIRAGRNVKIIHLGDHDPSGVDMSRDILDRLHQFIRHHEISSALAAKRREPGEQDNAYYGRISKMVDMSVFEVNRIALNMDQIRQYDPPPNPAKITDSRANSYISEHGDESWELDALDPDVLVDLIRNAVTSYMDEKLFTRQRDRQERERGELTTAASHWPEVSEFIHGLEDAD